MESKTLRVLIIEDSDDDTALMVRELRRGGYDPIFERVETPEGMEAALDKHTWDVVIADYTLPNFSAPAALSMMKERDLDLPFMIVSGTIGEDSAVAAMKAGAHDYIMKDKLARLNPAIERELREVASRRIRRKAEQALRESEEFSRSILMSLPFAVIIFGQYRKVEYINPVYLKDFDLVEEEIVGKDLFEILPFLDLERERIKKDVESFLSGTNIKPQVIEFDHRTFGYRLFHMLKGVAGDHKNGLIIRDITNEKKTQEQLIQSEKLAGIGIMASGIAHELNNPLSVVVGKAEMIMEEDISVSAKKYAEDIIKYSKKASEIVRSVTMYSRAAWAPGVKGQKININDQIDEVIKISKLSTYFDRVEILSEFQDIPPVIGNSREIQQVLTNLMRNAAQAMNGKGRLYVKTWHEDDSVVISIRDTGPGIKKENLNKLFTPFFTTKDPGKGTGLGLNIVHKIITNHGGTINVESEEGKGCTFIMRLPKAEEVKMG